MKKIIFLAFILSFFTLSCQNSETKRRKKAIYDSIFLAKKREKREKEKELERLIFWRSRRAWDDLRFGMTVKEFKYKKKYKEAYTYSSDKESCNFNISDYNLKTLPNRTEMEISFYNNSLGAITIKSTPKSARYWEVDILRIISQLKDRLTDENGDPTTSNPIPEFYELKPGIKKILYVWEIKSKEAKITIEEDYYNGKYQVICEISNYRHSPKDAKEDLKELNNTKEEDNYRPSPLLPLPEKE